MIDDMRVSSECVEHVKAFEGILDGDPSTVNLDPYICPAGYVTIGWGHVVLDDGEMLKGRSGLRRAKELIPDGITMDEATDYLAEDLEIFEAVIAKNIGDVYLTQSQFDAMVALAFNIGPGNFATSTVRRQTNAENFKQAADAFLFWNKAKDPDTGVLEVLPGLVRRRKAERAMYLSEL